MNSKKDTSATITFRLPASLKAAVTRVADKNHRSVSDTSVWLIRLGIRAYEETGLLFEIEEESGGAGLRNIESMRNGIANAERETRPSRRRVR